MTIEDWRDFFPPSAEGIRADQKKAVNFIGENLLKGTENISFEGPAGVGKSFVAWTLAHYFAVERGWKSRVLVPNRFLENQYLADFRALGLAQLHSSRHYTCPEFVSCDIGRNSEIIATQPEAALEDENGNNVTIAAPPTAVAVMRCENDEYCPYLHARAAFANAAIGVTNTAYALTCARFGHEWVRGDLLFVDEAHKLNDEICRLYEVVIPLDLSNDIPAEGGELDWVIQSYLPSIYLRIESINAAISRRMAEWTQDPVLLQLAKDLKRLNETVHNLNFLLATNPVEWAVTRTRYKLTFQPLWARRMGPRLLDFLAPRRVFLSATLLDYEHHLDTLGLSA
jgi:Rad3-related DNA helicase